MPELHIHVPQGFTGTVHIHHDGDLTTTITGPTGTDSIEADQAESDDVEAMLARHERHDPHTRSREVCQALVDDGWHARAAKTRDGNRLSDAGYVLLTYRGSTRHVVLYLNSKTLGAFGKAEREFAAHLRSGESKSSGVYFSHTDGDFEQALANAAAMRTFADGDDTPTAHQAALE